jgi:two-component system response regulator FixJ
MDGLRLIEQVRQRFPVLPTIVMTGYGDINKARSAMKRQAIEFLQKPFNPADLCSTARAAIVASRQLSRTAHLSPDTRLSKLLTPREYQVFNLIVDGFNTHQMSEALGISNRTVESHRANLRHKLGAESVADLVLFHSYCRH